MLKIHKLVMMLVLASAGISMHAMDAPDIKDQLASAARDGNYTEVLFLIEGTKHLSPDALTNALWLAAMEGHEQICRLLIKNGADRQILNKEVSTAAGDTPLMRAARRNDVRMLRYLIENGADASAITGSSGTTVLISIAFFGSREVIQTILTTIPHNEREKILEAKKAALLAHNLAIEKGVPVLPRDLRRVITQELINCFVAEAMHRVLCMLALENSFGQTAYDRAVRGDISRQDTRVALARQMGEEQFSLGENIAHLLDFNNPETRAWLRRELEKNIREILFSDPKKKM